MPNGAKLSLQIERLKRAYKNERMGMHAAKSEI